ncbi:MAG: glucosamine-6-phosphate deaminase [Lachnospiraceae bacterium]|nr:glucosamine-6-phosphate deaminase [Lachnospiraceae bacterium]
MKIIPVADYDEMSLKAADIVIDQINSKKDSIIALPIGSTPRGLYKLLVENCREGKLDFSDVRIFCLDEYIGIPDTDEHSTHYYMKHTLCDLINIDEANINIPKGYTSEPNISAESYERKIKTSTGIDLLILGLGVNGHIGFNEPDDYFSDDTHVVRLHEDTRQVNARFFDSIDQVPDSAVTVGIGTIMRAKKILAIVSGKNKHEALMNCIYGDVKPSVPVSILKFHPNVTIIADAEAYYG